jgi:FixJ family two-component response regulator
VITNFGHSEMAAAVRRIGAKRLLHKPVDSDTIIQTIEEFI